MSIYVSSMYRYRTITGELQEICVDGMRKCMLYVMYTIKLYVVLIHTYILMVKLIKIWRYNFLYEKHLSFSNLHNISMPNIWISFKIIVLKMRLFMLKFMVSWTFMFNVWKTSIEDLAKVREEVLKKSWNRQWRMNRYRAVKTNYFL